MVLYNEVCVVLYNEVCVVLYNEVVQFLVDYTTFLYRQIICLIHEFGN